MKLEDDLNQTIRFLDLVVSGRKKGKDKDLKDYDNLFTSVDMTSNDELPKVGVKLGVVRKISGDNLRDVVEEV